MKTLYDFGLDIQKIREAINSITVRGAENASYIVFAVNRCNELIKELNSIIEKQKNEISETSTESD